MYLWTQIVSVGENDRKDKVNSNEKSGRRDYGITMDALKRNTNNHDET